jgi:hypothetical protein
MRLHSPFPTAFPRVFAAGAETAIPDLAAPLPVGSLVAASTYVLGRSKEIWGDGADMWKLERWPGDEKGIKRLEDKGQGLLRRQGNCNADDGEDGGWYAREVGSYSEGFPKRGMLARDAVYRVWNCVC